ncbi:Ycf3-interacting protein 1, chloroplastic [Sesamum alatum]|uniref:Ycf3-interacting protein 1, chloroplastic n=1 Tax=Sesamum alatum TaxID=300844 RepID=A0AAE1Z2X0_9LAMI|nr:Ycf3-interacting protein 1, chloroplastic [Sesamum alatum]
MGVSGVLQPQPPPMAVSSLFYHRSSSLPMSYLPFISIAARKHDNGRISGLVLVNKEDTSFTSSSSPSPSPSPNPLPPQKETEQAADPDPEDLEYVAQIKTVLERLRKNRDMFFNEVKLTILIEDPRDVERRRLLGIDDENAPTRDDLAAALVQVNEGKIPENRAALQMLAEEMLQWPNLEVEAPKQKQRGKSLYAKFTDTGVNPQEAAKRLNIDWDSAAEIEDAETSDVEVPPAVGYGALYLVTAFPVIIGGERIWEECSVGMNRSQIILEKKESIQSEKQISVDPISLRESTMMYPVTTGPKTEVMTVPLHNLLPPAAAKCSGRFLSCSLPNSASSSPAKHKKKCKNHQERVSELGRQHSVALTNLERLRESHLRRSKSCGEESVCRPSLDFDLWSTTNNQQRNNEFEVRVDEEKIIFHKKGSEEGEPYEDKFKCGACLFLPGFGKGKTVRARKELELELELEPGPERVIGNIDIVSQRVSLEKFECGSWRSSAMINCEEDGDTTSSLFFDLPVELIRCSSVNDTESPVTAGFVFDNKDHEQHHLRKGVLKHSTSGQPRKSHESCHSSRHVRFSTSSPTLCPASPTSSCITPRLRKARDDFNAFLEAQSA